MTEEEKKAKQLERMREWRRRNPGYSQRYYKRNAEHITKQSRCKYLRNRENVARKNRERYHNKKQKAIEEMNVLKAAEIVSGLKDKLPQEFATKEVIEAIEQVCIITRYAPRWKDVNKRPPREPGKYLVTYYGGFAVAEMVLVPGAEPMWVSRSIGHISPEKWCYIPVMPKD